MQGRRASAIRPGEAAAITQAQEWCAVLVVTIPTIVVRLHLGGIISRRAAHRKLDLLERMTAPGFIEAARRLVEGSERP